MNLKLGKGKVPLDMGSHYVFLDFPNLEDFCNLYNKYTRPDKKVLYWHMMKDRANGMTLKEIGASYGVTRERVRAIEAKFMRLLRIKHYHDTLGKAV